jgi:tRNA A-37 threonylcarbamoyl transferase component Bud32
VAPPAWIGKYEVLEKIGEGGFAVVYKARDPFIKRLVAIKICVSEDVELRNRFFREAEIAGNLHHKNIVTVFDFGTDESRPYLVQEYLSGEDLKVKIQRRQPISEILRLDYLLQVAQGLAYAHSKGVLHRDVKPGNVRVLEDDCVKIMDFGIAKLAKTETALTRRGSILGTAGYLPPEQVLGREADVRADVFSYGALAYELLTYQPPFPGRTVSEILQQVLQSEPKPVTEHWRKCPSDLATLLVRCLEKDPARRYADFDELLGELQPILERMEHRALRGRYGAEPVSLDDTLPIPLDLSPPAMGLAPPGSGEPLTPTPGALVPPAPAAAPKAAQTPRAAKAPRAPGRAGRAVAVGAAWLAAAGGAAATTGRGLRRAWGAAGKRRRIALLAAAGVVALALAGLAWYALRPARAPAPSLAAASPAPPAPVPAGAATGRLVVDARPWAEVLAVVDAAGNSLPLPPDPYTPLVLDLPPGHYRVSLIHPSTLAPTTCEAEVAAAAPASCSADFGAVAVDDYFKQSGWWR